MIKDLFFISCIFALGAIPAYFIGLYSFRLIKEVFRKEKEKK